MFGTSGIRGVYGEKITEDLALHIGNVFAQNELVIGRDLRDSGLSLKNALCAGALAKGCDVIDIEIVPTPTVAFSGKRGIMITASHNPSEYNGFKLIEEKKEIGIALQSEITKKISGKISFGKNGNYSRDFSILEDHKNSIKKNIKTKKKPKVVIDCNGAAATISPYLLAELGCQVISLNSSKDCFNRPSEPNEKNLGHLSRMVVNCDADFGIAHDGDGDRCIIIDDKGQVLPFDIQLAMMIENELIGTNNKKIVTTVESSLAIRKTVEELGGSLYITPVGSTHVAEKMIENNAIFGGEPCGEYIYKEGVKVPDGPMAAAKFLEIFENGKISEQRKKYSHGFIVREKYYSKNKDNAITAIENQIKIDGKIRKDDGIRIDEEDGWFLIRKSGTEPIIRLTMEYETKEKLFLRKKELISIIEKSI